jgi:two-component system, NtrC family, response regulator AtoC
VSSDDKSVDPAAARFVLEVIAPGRNDRYPLPQSGRLTIGRGPTNDVVIDDPLVSRRHAALHVGAALRVQDLGSANGTRVSSSGSQRSLEPDATARIGRARFDDDDGDVLAPGEVLHIGSARLMVRAASAEAGLAAMLDEPRAESDFERPLGGAARVVLDAEMKHLYELGAQLADSTISVLLLGETGVGKELIAESIHRRSARNARPFLRLNCAALPEPLLESQLFGHERGAFTGAMRQKPGLLEAASGGTVFLDEIGELPISIQVKLLRVLEEGEVLRVGAVTPRQIDVRFIAATNRELEEEVARRTFREDLYFRISGVTLRIPPLRERPSEIEPLSRSFIADACKKKGRPEPELTADARAMLLEYAWPGNVRELKNVIQSALLFCGDGPIRAEHLPASRMRGTQRPRSLARPVSLLSASALSTLRAPTLPRDHVLGPSPDAAEPSRAMTADPDQLKAELERRVELAERDRISIALERCAGNQTQAAKLLGVSRRTLITRLEQYGLPRPRKTAAR